MLMPKSFLWRKYQDKQKHIILGLKWEKVLIYEKKRSVENIKMGGSHCKTSAMNDLEMIFQVQNFKYDN